ncbi:MAG: LysR family transcriptional regulator [Myxococcota bacterium]
MDSLSLELIRTFALVVEEGTLRAAAHRLGRTQPAITARIHQLEHQLGTPLFTRSGKRLELTPSGRAAAERAAQVVRSAEAFVREVGSNRDSPSGLLRIGALPTVSSYRIAPMLPALLETYPNLRAEVVLGHVAPMLTELRAARLDAVLWVGQPTAHDLEHRIVDTIRPAAVFRRHDAPAQADVELLRSHRYIEFGAGVPGDPFFDDVAGFVARNALATQSRLRVAHIHTIKQLVQAGGGYGILPSYTVLEPDLAACPIVGYESEFPLVCSTRIPQKGEDPVNRLTSLFLRALQPG